MVFILSDNVSHSFVIAKGFKLYFFAAAWPTCLIIPLLRKGKLLSTPQRRESLTEKTKLLDLRTLGGIRDPSPVRQKGSESDSSGSSSSSSEASANPKGQSL